MCLLNFNLKNIFTHEENEIKFDTNLSYEIFKTIIKDKEIKKFSDYFKISVHENKSMKCNEVTLCSSFNTQHLFTIDLEIQIVPTPKGNNFKILYINPHSRKFYYDLYDPFRKIENKLINEKSFDDFVLKTIKLITKK